MRTFLLTLALALPACAAPTIVQSNAVNAAANSIACSVTSTPASGNLLLAVIGYNAGADPFNAPDGTWTQILESNTSHVAVKMFWRTATGSSGSSFTFTGSGADAVGCVLYEIAGQASVAVINGSATNQESSYSPSSGAVTPSVVGCLAIAAISNNNAEPAGGVSSGWTLDHYTSNGSYHDLQTAVRTAPTSDTSTPISTAFGESSPVESAQAIVLIAPGSAPPPATPASNALFYVAKNEPPRRGSR